MKKRVFSFLIALVMTTGIMPAISLESQAAEAAQYKVGSYYLVTTDVEGGGCTIEGDYMVINQPGTYTISLQDGKTTARKGIRVKAEATLILDNMEINASGRKIGLFLEADTSIRTNGLVELIGADTYEPVFINGCTLTFLGGEMIITASEQYNGLSGNTAIRGSDGNAKFVIKDGTLTVNGGKGSYESNTNGERGGYGIGHGAGGYVASYMNITVDGGTLIVSGGDGGNSFFEGGYGSAAIYGDEITINSGTVIAAGGKGGTGTREGNGKDSRALYGTIITPTSSDYVTTIWAGDDADSATIVSNYDNQKYVKYEVIKGCLISYSGLEDAVCENKPNAHKEGENTWIPNPVKTGYTFDGWIVNGSGVPVKDLTLEANTYSSTINLEAQWSINQYTITFDTDGGTYIAPITQDYNTDVTVPANPTKTGYIFNCWDMDIPTTIPAENITVKALWTKCTHENNTNENYTFDDTTHSIVCSLCQETITNDHIGGTTTCIEKAVCSVCNNTYGSVNKDNHVEYEYTAQENIITVSCKSCDYSGTFTLKAPENLVYDATKKTATIEGNIPGVSAPDIKYEGDCTNVGTHKASITLVAGDNTYKADLSFDIIAASIKNAKVSAGNAVYDGTPHTPTVTVKLDSKTLIENTDYKIVSYSDNMNAGTAKIEIEGIGNYKDTVFGNFIIEPIDGSVTDISDISKTYDGETVANPTYTSLSKGNVIFEYKVKDADDSTYTTTAPSDVGEYIVRVTVAADNNYKEASNTAEFTIAQKEIGISWGATEFLPYTGQVIVPEATATCLVNGDVCSLTTSVLKTTDGAGIVPGEWEAEVTAISNSNYKLPENITTSFTIINGNQDKPVLSSTSETVDGRNDGEISDLTTAMEYKKASDSTYTPITSERLTNLSDGTYHVRYAAKQYYNASPDTEVIIYAGNKLNINIPENQNGYTLEVNKTEVSWEEPATLTFALKDGYTKTEAFAVKVNNEIVPLDANGAYTISDIQENQTITVEGVADITAPTAAIKVTTNEWKEFITNITFGAFFKEPQEVTITANDVNTGSGLDKIYYYLSETEIAEADIASVTDWVEYTEVFNINPDKKYVIYAKAVDKAGNIVFINSEGLVLDATAPEITGITNGGTYYGNTEFGVTESYLDKVTLDGTSITLTDGKYTIVADDKEHTIVATDKATNSNATMKIKVVAIASLDEAIEELTTSNVKSSDKEAIEEILELAESLLDSGKDFTDAEDTKLAEIKSNAESLLDQIKNAEDAADNETTDKVEGITSGNVTTSDKEHLEDAKVDLEQALRDYPDNYTESEKEAIKADIQRIEDALKSIEKVEDAADKITTLPSSVEPDNLETVDKIKDAKAVYDALTDHEKSLISADDKAKLESLLSQAVAYKIVEGNGMSIREDSEGNLRFKANGAYSKFTGIKVDNHVIDASYYTAESGSTIITLKNEFLDKLSVGTHSLAVIYTDGEATGNFKITAQQTSQSNDADNGGTTSEAVTEATQVQEVPPMGDGSNVSLYITTLLFTSVGLILLTIIPKRKRS